MARRKTMLRKKVILVLVEGASDETALGPALKQVYDIEYVHIHVVYGDITTRKGVSPTNVVTKVFEELKRSMDTYGFKAEDFVGIMHIVDTDGTFISDDAIVESPDCSEVIYEDDRILTSNGEGIRKRNHQKREFISRLIATGAVKKIPYRVYYMSCNLDHVLYDKRNSSDEEKETDSYAFANRYKDDADGFLEFMCESAFSVHGDFKETWNYIRTGNNSLARHSNICVELVNKMKDDVATGQACARIGNVL